jgi:hypothetical protein
MMSTIIYKALGDDIDAQAMFIGLISPKERKVAEKLEDVQSYRAAGDIVRMNVKQGIDELRRVKLGNLEAFKNDIIDGLRLLL